MVERGLLVLGLLLLVTFSFAYTHRFVMFRAEMTRFEAKQFESAKEGYEGEEVVSGEKRVGVVYQTGNIKC